MRIVASLLVIALVGRATADDSKPRVPDRLFSDTWHAFETVGPNDQVFFENPAQYWSELSYEMFFVFAARAVEPTRDEWCEYFVNQFGKHGAESDLRWLIMDTSYTVPYVYVDSTGRPPEKLVANRMFRHIVLRCMTDPVFRDRYMHAVLWSRAWHRKGVSESDEAEAAIRTLADGFPTDADHSDGDYWGSACRFILLIYLTDREDVIKGADPTKLGDRFVEWKKWYHANRHRLVADPKRPRWVLGHVDRIVPGDFALPELNLPARPFPDIGDRLPSPDLLAELSNPSQHAGLPSTVNEQKKSW